MDEVSQAEAEKYTKMWAVPGYRQRSPGERCLGSFQLAAEPLHGSTIIDFGVGCGRAALALQQKGFPVTGVDLTETCLDADIVGRFNFVKASLWELPESLSARYGYCTDVMEHIPEDKVDDVLANQVRCCEVGCFYQIATFRDTFGRKINCILHLTVKNTEWWDEKLRQHWPHVNLVMDGRSPQFWCHK